MGLTKDEFMHSTPKILEAYNKAYVIKMKEMDRLAWSFCGNYVMSAVVVSLEACLAGKKAKGKYIEAPMLERMGQDTDETKLQKQRELFVAQLEVMKANFELNKKLKDKEVGKI